MKKLEGVVVPIVTPLTEDDQIDVESLKKLVDYLIEEGVQALYPCGTTGEMMYLNNEERKLVAETVVKQAAGRVTVFVHVGAWNTKDTIELAQHAEKIGADGIGVVTPTFFKMSDQGLIDYFTEVAHSVSESFPVYLYAIPQNAINDINVSVAESCKKANANIIGIKYSAADMTRIQQLMRVNGGDFSVLTGPDQLFEAVVAMGGDGTISGNAQCIPKHYETVWSYILKDDYKNAAKWQHKTNAINEVLCKYNNIAAYKVILKNAGIIATKKTRKPMPELTAAQEEELVAGYKQLTEQDELI